LKNEQKSEQQPAWTVAIFDLDGTLTDPGEGIVKCIEHAFAGLELESPAARELEKWIGPPLYASFAEALDDAGLAKRALALYRQRFATEGLFENRLIPGIRELLESLVEVGVSCYLATSKPGVYASRIVQHFGLDQWLRGVYGSEMDGKRADKSDLLAHLLECEAIDPGQAVMIGDRYHDMHGAIDNRIKALGVTWGYGSRMELETAGANGVVDTVEQLAEYFQLKEEEPI
jgi:phosphoglycolate phosphatase